MKYDQVYSGGNVTHETALQQDRKMRFEKYNGGKNENPSTSSLLPLFNQVFLRIRAEYVESVN